GHAVGAEDGGVAVVIVGPQRLGAGHGAGVVEGARRHLTSLRRRLELVAAAVAAGGVALAALGALLERLGGRGRLALGGAGVEALAGVGGAAHPAVAAVGVVVALHAAEVVTDELAGVGGAARAVAVVLAGGVAARRAAGHEQRQGQ